MKRVAFALYRNWAYDILLNIIENKNSHTGIEIPLLITTPEAEFEDPSLSGLEVVKISGKDQEKLFQILSDHQIDTVFFYGWSWMVREPIISDFTCVCLHPSPLPRYRGGSPIQHQIIAGENRSAVSIIKMSPGIDDGDIYTQIPFDLTGYLPEILKRITDAGVIGTKKYLEDLREDKVIFTPQLDLDQYLPLKRRSPEDSNLAIESLQKISYNNFYNLVRGLQIPYPLVNIKEGRQKLLIEEVQFISELPRNITLFGEQEPMILNFPVGLRLADGFALVTKGSIENLI